MTETKKKRNEKIRKKKTVKEEEIIESIISAKRPIDVLSQCNALVSLTIGENSYA